MKQKRMTHTDSSESSSSYQVLLAPPAGTTPVNNPHNIMLRLFNRDPSSPIQSIVFSALHCDSGLLFARTHPCNHHDHHGLYVGGHTTKKPGLRPGGALLEEHLVSVTTFSLPVLDLYARPEPLLPTGVQAAPRDQWAASFVVVAGNPPGMTMGDHVIMMMMAPPPPQHATTTP
jgi:hypothetical protein